MADLSPLRKVMPISIEKVKPLTKTSCMSLLAMPKLPITILHTHSRVIRLLLDNAEASYTAEERKALQVRDEAAKLKV